MFFFSICQQRQTVFEARVTFELTSGTSLGALREMFVVFMLGAG
jgi:hypothetical protein